jgi:hypothetical protein
VSLAVMVAAFGGDPPADQPAQVPDASKTEVKKAEAPKPEPRKESPAEPKLDPVAEALKSLEDADNDWRVEQAASEKLAKLGEKAVNAVIQDAEDHEKARVRRTCYSLLTTSFATNPWAIQAVIRSGLSDKDERIRYECAFRLGDLKVYRAHVELRRVLNGAGKNEMLRFSAAKSLAQLGEADVLPELYKAVTDDHYMPRMIGNAGLKALSGKNLNDFACYNYGEGAFVSGGVEATTQFDAITLAEKKARRFQAATDYFKWLRKERPDLYKHLTYF